MDPPRLAALAVGALHRSVVDAAVGAGSTPGAPVAPVAPVDDRLASLLAAVRAHLAHDRRGQRSLREFEAAPDDPRGEGRLELALEAVIESDPDFATWLAAVLDDLGRRPPPPVASQPPRG